MMSEFEGTKGPWEVEDKEFVVSGDRAIATVGGVFLIEGDKENANLIAAAPDLLEALQVILINFRDACTGDLVSMNDILKFDASVVKARAAIAKALGETK